MEVAMYLQQFVGLFLFGLKLVNSEQQGLTKHPYGPKMCDQLCDRVIGCSSPSFVEAHLYCQVTLPSSSMKEMQNKACPSYSIHLYRGSEKAVCVETARNYATNNLTKLTKERLRVLIMGPMASSKERNKVYVLNPDNGEMTLYPYINSVDIIAVVAVFTQRRLLISIAAPIQHVESYELYSKDKIILVKHFSPVSMAVDEEKKLIFGCSSAEVRRMATGTNGSTVLYTCSSKETAKAVAVHPGHEILYVLFVTQILSFTYEGKDNKTIVNNENFRNQFIHVKNEFIYFTRDKQIFKRSLYTGSEDDLKLFDEYYPNRLVVFGEEYFVTLLESRSIYLMDNTLRKVLHTFDWKFTSATKLEVCVVPHA